MLVFSSTIGAAESTNSPDLQCDLPALEGQNQIDNPNQMDRPAELATGHNSPLASLTIKQTCTSYMDSLLPVASNQSTSLTLFQPSFLFPSTEDGTTNFLSVRLFHTSGSNRFWMPQTTDYIT
jgi:hypothetical protein